MRFSTAVAAFLPVLASSVYAAQNITVAVGSNMGLTYSPSNVTAEVGDTIQFIFMAKNHTVTQSTFAAPCENMTTPAAGIDSGFLAVTNGSATLPTFSFTVNDTSAPLWFYCRQTGHCQKGMVFSVNANPNSNKSFEAFQKLANASTPASASASASGSSGSATSGASPSASAASTANGAATHGIKSAVLLSAVGFGAGLLL